MKALCLYIDRWHLLGALCTEETILAIDDKYWFSFHENIEAERVDYGKSNETNYLNKKEHYVGDIFSLLTDPRETFSQYGHQVEIKKIFAASGMLDDLADATGFNGKIDTFISFAEEVPEAARLVFIEAMEDHRFVIKEKVARIEHLLLEYAIQNGKIADDGRYLVFNATTNDLRYSIYYKSSDIFVEERNDTLRGVGTDARGSALVEAVVAKMNKSQFLSTTVEYERERIRMTRLYLDGWLARVSNTPENLPVTFSNVSFSISPNNREDVMVLVRDINDRTRAIVAEIVQKIAKFAGELARTDLKGILFLGDIFSNQNFVNEILSRFSINNSQLHYFRKVNLPSIVSMYCRIDCGQFSTANEQFDINSEAELMRIQNAIEEQERQRIASEELSNARKKEDEKRNAEKSYKEAMEHVYEFERKGDFPQMKEWCEIALKIKPDEEGAKGKLDDALRLLSEEKLRHEQYNEALRKAKTGLKEKRYQDALSHSEIALVSMPGSEEAKRILSTAREQLNTLSQIERLIDRSDLFFAQKLYSEALNEISKILAIDSTNQQAKQRKNEIEKVISEKQSRVASLEQQLQNARTNSDFSTAKKTLEILIIEDSENQIKWSAMLQDAKRDEIAATERAQKLASLKKKIEKDVFDEQWSDVVAGCKASLELSFNEEIQIILQRAEEKIARIKELEYLNNCIDSVKVLIAEKDLNEARKKLNDLKKSHPQHDDLYKPLYKAIFDAEDNAKSSDVEQSRKPIGFNNRGVSVFFEIDSNPPKTPPTKRSPHTQKPHKTGDSFFDMDESPQKTNGKTSKNFNF